VLKQLDAIIKPYKSDPPRGIVIHSGKSNGFIMGADINEFTAIENQDAAYSLIRLGQQVLSGLEALRCPTVAVINGFALGGGLELALACDLRVAASSARVGLTETSLAIIPGAGGTQRLPAVVGVARAKELVFTARQVPADEALALGLVQAVVQPAELVQRATDLARAIAANGPLAVAAAKAALDLADGGLPLSQRLDGERALYLERVLPSADRLEALAAFRDKRKPEYQGR
jgi:enoyl-CoA hydratase/carnithine racemase